MKIASVATLRHEIETEMNIWLGDSAKLLGTGNKSAGRRSRVSSNRLTHLFKEWRRLTMEADNEG